MNASKSKNRLGMRLWKSRYIYLFLLPGILYFLIFCYRPMAGLVLAFKKYNAGLGVWGSPWVGLDNFRRLFITPLAKQAIRTTIVISCGRLAIEFIFPILLALMLNEMPGRKLKRVYQTVFTFPHFLSWIIIARILQDLFANNGAVNALLARLGAESTVKFLSTPSIFRGLIYFTSIWKEAGWSAIIYIAAIAGISQDLYEAATIDGAGRLQSIWHVTLPGIRTTIVLLLIMQLGNMMNAGFDQIFNMRNPAVKNSIDIIDTYVYDITFDAVPNYGFSTAVGMFKSCINCALLLVANGTAKKVTGEGLFN